MIDSKRKNVNQDPPFTIKVEMTEGCCLYCSFCGIRGIRTGPGDYKFMTIQDAGRIASQIADLGWTAKIEFTMHGEPTMNPRCAGIVGVFREYLPNSQFMLTSNGGGLQKKARLEELFDSGLNILALDDYQHANFVDNVVDSASDLGIPVFEYPQQKKYTPHSRVNVKKGEHYVVVLRDISTGDVGTRKLSNHCGCAGPLDFSVTSRCARPFRELVIRYDLKVPICCNDWRSEYVCGDLDIDPLSHIWHNSKFEAARKLLYFKKREFKPCYGCNSRSYRVGLLPDKLGKCSMGHPSEDDYTLVESVSTDEPLTDPILRPWETQLTLKDRIKSRGNK